MGIVLTACGDPKTTDDGPVTFDEDDYIEALTEEEQIAKSQSDKELYKQAKAEGNPAICEKIEFITLKKLCLEEAQR